MFPAMEGAGGEIDSPIAAAESIREATEADAEVIEAVHFASREAAYSEHVAQWPPSGPDREGRVARWRAWLSTPDIHCLVLEHDGRILGFCTVRPSADEDDDSATVAEMPTLYVHPAHWRVGLGAALCLAAIGRATELGFSELTLWVLEINDRARTFYRALGFRPDGARKIDEGTVEGLAADRYRIALEGPAA